MQTESDWKTFDAATAEFRRHPPRMEKLAYRAPGTTSVPARTEDPPDEGRSPAAAAEQAAALARLEERLRASEAATEARIEELRRAGRENLDEARRQAGVEAQAAIEAGGREVAAALLSFAREREEYFANVEREVVKLALAIAARILHREALLDPLLLTAAARVALGQLGETTGVRLRCPPGQVEHWREILGRLPNLPVAPEVVGDTELEPGDCRLEARVGTVDLGVHAQLAEIERGFFDLLEQRPGAVGNEPG